MLLSCAVGFVHPRLQASLWARPDFNPRSEHSCWQIPLQSEVWTRVLWILRVPPDKRAFSRAGMLVCQPWLWPDTFRHYQFRGITSINGITSISSSTGITSSHGCGFARHTSPNKTDSYFFRAFWILRAFSGFAGLLRFFGPSPGLRAPPTSACSLIFIFIFQKK